MIQSQYIERGWCQNDVAKDVFSQSVTSDSPNAVSWCLAGACSASQASGIIAIDQLIDLKSVLRNLISDPHMFSISRYNDDPTHSKKQVLDIIKQAEKTIGLVSLFD